MLAVEWEKDGLTKEEAEEIIWLNAKKTAGEFRADPFYPPYIEPVLKGRSMYGEKDLWPKRYLNLPAHESIQVFPHKHVKIVIVGGGTNPHAQVWQMSMASSVIIDNWR